MLYSKSIAITAVAVGMLFPADNIASAQQKKAEKLTYEQAFAKCKATDMVGAGTDYGAGASQRVARAGACMKRYGYRLKQ